MWLCTQHGFYSIAQKGADEFHIRARRRTELLNLKLLSDIRSGIKDTRDANYRYRLIVSRVVLVQVMKVLACDLDYPNFRENIAADPELRDELPFYEALHEGMRSLQPKPRGKPSKQQ